MRVEGGREGVRGLPPWGGGKAFRAYDKQIGEVVWESELPGGTTGAPMTYMAGGRQDVVVAVGWHDDTDELVALALLSHGADAAIVVSGLTLSLAST